MTIVIRPTKLEGVILIETRAFFDERGFFTESYNRRRYAENGMTDEFVQDNHSCSVRDVIRAFHYQDDSAPMAKLVRCVSGAILDVAVDLRVRSPTFAQWIAVELSYENRRQLMVPHGFGHGFLALSERADVVYKTTGYYTPTAEGAVAWDDADIGVNWPCAKPILSPRDRAAPTLREYRTRPAFT
jgi:dTDP-4-dehydrorhamnose 3,5-epimerase